MFEQLHFPPAWAKAANVIGLVLTVVILAAWGV